MHTGANAVLELPHRLLEEPVTAKYLNDWLSCACGTRIAAELREAFTKSAFVRQSKRRAGRGLNAIRRPRQVEESAPVRSDCDGNCGFSESARSDRRARLRAMRTFYEVAKRNS